MCSQREGSARGYFLRFVSGKRGRGRRPGETVYQRAIVAAIAPLRMQQIDTPTWKLEILQQRCRNGVPPVIETGQIVLTAGRVPLTPACVCSLVSAGRSPACLTQTNSILCYTFGLAFLELCASLAVSVVPISPCFLLT